MGNAMSSSTVETQTTEAQNRALFVKRAAARAWAKANPDKIKASKLKDRQNTREAIRARQHAWYLRNREKSIVKEKERYAKNRADIMAKNRIRILKNPEKYRAMRQEFRQSHRGNILLSGAKKYCRVHGIHFDLTVSWVQSRIDAGVCEMSGLPFDMAARRGANTPSIDRIDPKGPYTQANCRVILWFINRALSNYGEEYSLKVFRAIIERHRE